MTTKTTPLTGIYLSLLFLTTTNGHPQQQPQPLPPTHHSSTLSNLHLQHTASSPHNSRTTPPLLLQQKSPSLHQLSHHSNQLSSLHRHSNAQQSSSLIYPRFDCSPDHTGFELMTGVVFSSPADLLDSQPGTLMLADCLEACRLNSSCRAANYETGLCVLFSADEGVRPGALTPSQFPVFTLYAQKVCLSGHCERAWDYERVPNHRLRGNAIVRKERKTGSRASCMELCLSERDFVCRSATYTPSTGDCTLSHLDRLSLSNNPTPLINSSGTDYMESNCVNDPNRLCDFRKLENKILKTVDAVYQEVASKEDCQSLCISSTGSSSSSPFRCTSYDYNATGPQVCRLSHHSTPTLTPIKDPFLTVPGAATYELSACYNVSVDCRAGELVATVRTSKLFQGKLYAKGAPNSCSVDVENGLEFELRLGYSDLDCGVRRGVEQGVGGGQGSVGRFETEVILQHHDQIVTSSDMGLSVACQYDLTNKSVSNEVDLGVVGDLRNSITQESVVDSPNVVMRVTDRGVGVGEDGGGVNKGVAQVGDPLTLRFEITDPNSPYDIFVRELVAMDGVDGAEITLLDGEGCPTDPRILGALVRAPEDPKSLIAAFEAFKFPTSEIVQFRALVTPCLPECKPVVCPGVGGDLGGVVESYGKRRRRREVGLTLPPAEEMLLVKSIRISDKFGGSGGGGQNGGSGRGRSREEDLDLEIENEPSNNPRFHGNTKEEVNKKENKPCLSLRTAFGAGAIVLLVQAAMLGLGAVLFFKRGSGGVDGKGLQGVGHHVYVKRY